MAIALDSKSATPGNTTASPTTTSQAIATGARIYVAVTGHGGTGGTISGVTVGGVAATLVKRADNGTTVTAAIYELIAPPTGTQTISVAWSGFTRVEVASVSFTGVKSHGLGVATTGTTTATGTPTGGAADWSIAVAGWSSATAPTGPSATSDASVGAGTGSSTLALGVQHSAAGNAALSWTSPSATWAEVALYLSAVLQGAANDTVTVSDTATRSATSRSRTTTDATTIGAGAATGGITHHAQAIDDPLFVSDSANAAIRGGTVLAVRERPPLRLMARIDTPNGKRYRWAPDAAVGSVLNDETFSDTLPGGFESASASLARKIVRDFPDLEEFATVTIESPGGIAWQGRLEGAPRTLGQNAQGVQPQLAGWQNHLTDDNSAREIIIDKDLSHWGGMTIREQLAEIAGNFTIGDGGAGRDPVTGNYEVIVPMPPPGWPTKALAESWYDSGGIPLGRCLYSWRTNQQVGGANWAAGIWLSEDDAWAGAVDGQDFTMPTSSASGSGSIAASKTTYKWLVVYCQYNIAYGGPGNYSWGLYLQPVVLGNHGIALYGAWPYGVLSSDVEAYVIGKWCPALQFTVGQSGTIQPSSFAIPHLVFMDATNAGEMVRGATRFELRDWAVWDGPRGLPTYYSNERGAYSRAKTWRARVGEAQLDETGASADRAYNGAIVQFTDVDGSARTAGPPGSGCSVEDARLADSDPSNPANQRGIRRYAPPIQMTTDTSEAAIVVGAKYLSELKLIDTSGQAVLTGHVMDDKGVLWPYHKVRAGDSVMFTDAANPSPRRIVRTEKSRQNATCQVQLDAPPDALQQLLERLQVSEVPIGFG